MIDCGDLRVRPATKALVASPRLREPSGNGQGLGTGVGASVAIPARVADHPNRSFLERHLDAVLRRRCGERRTPGYRSASIR